MGYKLKMEDEVETLKGGNELGFHRVSRRRPCSSLYNGGQVTMVNIKVKVQRDDGTFRDIVFPVAVILPSIFIIYVNRIPFRFARDFTLYIRDFNKKIQVHISLPQSGMY